MKVFGRTARSVAAVCSLLTVAGASAAEPPGAQVVDQVTIHVTAVIPQAVIQCSLLILDDRDIDGKPGRDVVGVRLLLPASLAQLPLNTSSIMLGGKLAEPLGAPSSVPAGELMLFRRGDVERAGGGHRLVVLESEIGAGHRIIATEGSPEAASLTWGTTAPTATVSAPESVSTRTASVAATRAVTSGTDRRALLLEARRARRAQRAASR